MPWIHASIEILYKFTIGLILQTVQLTQVTGTKHEKCKHCSKMQSILSIESWQLQCSMLLTGTLSVFPDYNVLSCVRQLCNKEYIMMMMTYFLCHGCMWNKIISKLFQHFISHVTTSESEIKLFQPLKEFYKLFPNYVSDNEHVGKYS